MALERVWESLPSSKSFCLFRNQVGILNWAGFCMMVTIRSSSSELSSPALISACVHRSRRSTAGMDSKAIGYARIVQQVTLSLPIHLSRCVTDPFVHHARPDPCNFRTTHRLLRSTSAFLQTKLAYRRPIPLISVKANMIFPPPLTLVLRRRRMCCWISICYTYRVHRQSSQSSDPKSPSPPRPDSSKRFFVSLQSTLPGPAKHLVDLSHLTFA